MKKHYPTILYSEIFWMYWGAFAIISGFASVFLLYCGYTNTEIGILLAIGNVVSMVIQPISANVCDRSKRVTPLEVMMVIGIIIMLSEVFTLFVQHKHPVLFVAFLMMFAFHASMQPLLNSISTLFAKVGVWADYGFSRGMGSLGYSLMCGALGATISTLGESRLPIVGEVLLLLMVIGLFFMNKRYHAALAARQESGEITQAVEKTQNDISMGQFIRSHKLFLVMTIGIFIMYYHHQIINFFLLQVYQNVGGDSSDMGTYYFVMSLLEMPALFGFNWINKKFSTATLLKVGVIGLWLRGLTMFMAHSPLGILLSLIVNPIGFPLFLAAIVKYIGEIMQAGEAVRGQSLYVIAITASSVVASFTGGIILDAFGAHTLLTICLICCSIGAVMIYPLIDKAGNEGKRDML